MPLTKEKKSELVSKYGRNEQDTGSPEVQVAMLSKRIRDLTEHLKKNPKDFACRRGMLMLVGKRRRLLNYYKKKVNTEQYRKLITTLKIRK